MRTTTLKDWDQVGVELGVLGQLEANYQKINGEINEQLALLKTEKQELVADMQREIKGKELVITEFVEEHMDDIRTKDSKEMTFSTGKVKTKLVIDHEYPSDEILEERMKKLKLDNLIKYEPKINKKPLKDLEPAVLKKLGIKVTENISIVLEPHF